jgi:hypothetical protein
VLGSLEYTFDPSQTQPRVESDGAGGEALGGDLQYLRGGRQRHADPRQAILCPCVICSWLVSCYLCFSRCAASIRTGLDARHGDQSLYRPGLHQQRGRPGRTPYQFTQFQPCSGHNCRVTSSSIPIRKRLVIQLFSMVGAISSPGTFVEASLIANATLVSTKAPPIFGNSGGREFAFDQSVQAYVDADTLFAWKRRQMAASTAMFT